MAEVILSIDFETVSLVDLRRTGVYTYAVHPSTRVILMGWAFDNDPVQSWRIGDPFPQVVKDHIDRGGHVRAWNAGFEWVIWNKVLTRQENVGTLSLNQLHDTMAAAAYWGLPLSLDQAAPAAGLSITKDKEGHALMMRMCKPRIWNPVTGQASWWHEDDPDKLERLAQYCRLDVATERAVANSIPELPDDERQVWKLDQIINHRGVGVDYELVEKLKRLAEVAAKNVNAELVRLTNGQVTSVQSHAALLEWLKFHGYPYDNLRKDTVAKRLDEDGLSETERMVLELRADGAKTSAAKLQAMLDACPSRQQIGTVRGMLQYYGASRTGRWAGRLIQLQNMPRGSIKNVDAAISLILADVDPDLLEAVFGPALSIVSSCLRGCIVARPGRVLAVADFSQIEARVVVWLAGQQDALEIFARNEDIYTYTAAKIGSDNRQLGKVLVLACGFGMSWQKFKTTAEGYGIYLSDVDAENAVAMWRTTNSKVCSFWWACDRAARSAIQNPGQIIECGPVKFCMYQGNLLCRLPSGRSLVYRDAKLVPSTFRRGEQDISYMGVNQYTRKWERLRTYGGKLVENIVQATARDVMRDAMLKADRQGINVTLTVHDELLTEPPEDLGDQTLDALLTIMRTPPKWAAGLPVNGAGWVGHRYKK